MPLVNINTFPYSEDKVADPYTDGILDSGPESSIFLAPVGSTTPSINGVRKNSGCVVAGYTNDTTIIHADKIWYPQSGGSC